MSSQTIHLTKPSGTRLNECDRQVTQPSRASYSSFLKRWPNWDSIICARAAFFVCAPS